MQEADLAVQTRIVLDGHRGTRAADGRRCHSPARRAAEHGFAERVEAVARVPGAEADLAQLQPGGRLIGAPSSAGPVGSWVSAPASVWMIGDAVGIFAAGFDRLVEPSSSSSRSAKKLRWPAGAARRGPRRPGALQRERHEMMELAAFGGLRPGSARGQHGRAAEPALAVAGESTIPQSRRRRSASAPVPGSPRPPVARRGPARTPMCRLVGTAAARATDDEPRDRLGPKAWARSRASRGSAPGALVRHPRRIPVRARRGPDARSPGDLPQPPQQLRVGVRQ